MRRGPNPDRAARRAARLIGCYPPSWRARYGEEFTELLIADLAGRPRSWRRTTDVVRTGFYARLTAAGLTSHALPPGERERAGLVSVVCALAGFLVFGMTMWSQVTIGWQWQPPSTVQTTAGVLIMSAALLVLVIVAALAGLPIAGAIALQVIRNRSGRLVRPVLLFASGAACLVAGARHFENGWPGSGGRAVAEHFVPGGLAAFGWASTLSISSYWAHPSALRHFPVSEVEWMAVSPLAMTCIVVGAVKTMRRLDLPVRVLRFEESLGRAAVLTMLACLTGAAIWVLGGGSGPKNLFHAGAIDVAGLAVMAVALLTAERATARALKHSSVIDI